MGDRRDSKPGAKRAINNADLIRQSQNYSLVDFEDDIPIEQPKKRDKQIDGAKSRKLDAEKVKSKSKSKSKSLRDYGDKHESSEDETIIKRGAPKILLKANDSEIPESDRELTKMNADIEERDAFVARMQEKEDSKTKKLAEKGLTSEQIRELTTRGSISSGTAQVSSVPCHLASRCTSFFRLIACWIDEAY